MSEWTYYRVRETTIDGPDFAAGETVEITLLCQVIPMGEGTRQSPLQLNPVDFGGPRRPLTEDGAA